MNNNDKRGKVLIIDDNESLLDVIEIALERDNHKIYKTTTPSEGLKILDEIDIDIVLQDIRLPEMNGVELLKKIKEKKPNQIVFLMTAYSTWDSAVEAMRMGAFGYFEKKSPFDTDELRNKIKVTIQKILREKNRSTSFFAASQILGDSKEVQEVQKLIEIVAPTESPVLIFGESGTGKELIAKSLHYSSLRNNNTYLTFNCGEFSNTLIESELFGHMKGAFTGAHENKKGLIEQANGGTLFMDELGEMTLDMQVRLLRVLENHEVRAVGANAIKKVDVRFIFATNRNLEEMVENGSFRQDLYYRINVININLPPLRNRVEDIPMLVGSFLNKYKQNGQTIKTISEVTFQSLKKYSWPGNIRELQNRVQRASILSNDNEIKLIDIFSEEEIDQLKLSVNKNSRETIVEVSTEATKNIAKETENPTTRQSAFDEKPLVEVLQKTTESKSTENQTVTIPENFDLEKELEVIEKSYIEKALILTEGNLTNAAKLLNLSFRSVRYKVKKYKIKH